MNMTKVEFDAMRAGVNKKILDWEGCKADEFANSFSNDEVMVMIDEMSGMRFDIDASYFLDSEQVDAYKVLSNYIRRWIMEEVEECNVYTARELLDKLDCM